MKKYNITTQVFVLFALHMVALFLLLILVLYFANRIHHGTERIVKENVSSMEAAIHLKRQIYHQKEAMTELMTEGWNPLLMGRLFKEEENFESWLEKAKDSAFTEKEKKIVGELSSFYQQIDAVYKDFLERKGVPVGTAVKVVKDYDVMRELCMQLLNTNKELIDQTMMKKDTYLRYMYVSAIALVMVSFGLLFGLFFTRSVTKPLRKLVDDTRSVVKYSVEEHEKSMGNEINMLENQLHHITYLLEDSGKTINEQRQRLLHAERLAAIGEISAKIAHEVRNPLTGIRTGIQLIKRQNETDDQFQQKLARMIQELNRVERIVSDMLNYSRPLKPNFQKVDLIKLLRESASWVEKNLDEKQISLEMADYAPLIIEADSDMLKQVFYNILNNACENLGSGNRLTIKIDNEVFDSSSFAHLIFEDDGPGIKSDLLDKIFKPFFSTKPKGTGLGLAICQNIVIEHKGKIWAENGNPKGLRFNIVLPKRQENA
jgi:signal transduction histidine kinase